MLKDKRAKYREMIDHQKNHTATIPDTNQDIVTHLNIIMRNLYITLKVLNSNMLTESTGLQGVTNVVI